MDIARSAAAILGLIREGVAMAERGEACGLHGLRAEGRRGRQGVELRSGQVRVVLHVMIRTTLFIRNHPAHPAATSNQPERVSTPRHRAR